MCSSMACRPAPVAALLAFVALVGGCAQHDSPLAPYANAPLSAGVGLGDLKLGQTTLAAVVQRLGVETVTPLASDEIGLELFYQHGQLALLFIIEPECMNKLKSGLRPATVDLPAFLARTPCMRDAKLSSISVRVGSTPGDTWFQGASDLGVKLWAPGRDALKYGTPGGGSAHLVAGLNPNNPDEQYHFQRGICIYVLPDTEGTLAPTHVQRITLFPPVR
jgi:hypothetical protein